MSQVYPNKSCENQDYPDQGHPNQDYPNQGHPNQDYPNQGYPNNGYEDQGYPNQGYPNQGYPNQGFTVTSQPQTNTTVITQQQVQQQKRDWSSGICSCFEDMGVCLLTSFCGQCYICYLASKMGDSCCVPWCVPMPLVPMRAAFRERHSIRGTICDDYICASFCGVCVMCQLAREMKATGEL